MRNPAICAVGRAAAAVKSERLELGRGAAADPSEVVVDRLEERLGMSGKGGDAEEASRAGEEGGTTDDRGDEADEIGDGDETSEEESAGLLEGGGALVDVGA